MTHLLLTLNHANQSLKVQARCETSGSNDRPLSNSPKWCTDSKFLQKEMISFSDCWVIKSSHRHSEVSQNTSWKNKYLTAAGASGSNYTRHWLLWGADNITINEKNNVLFLIICFSWYEFDQGWDEDVKKSLANCFFLNNKLPTVHLDCYFYASVR